MAEPAIFFQEVNERQGAFHRRAFLMGGFAGAGLLALGGRLAYLQLFQTQRYEKLSASNQFNFKLMPPPRGLIIDRNGVVLASNRPNFRLLVSRDKDMDVPATLKTLAQFVPLDDKRQARLLRDIDNAPRRSRVEIFEDMSWEQFSAIHLRTPAMRGVSADMGEVRVYPHGGAFSHVIGYVAKSTRTTSPRPAPTPSRSCSIRGSVSGSRALRRRWTWTCADGRAPRRSRSTPTGARCATTARATSPRCPARRSS